MPGIQGSDNISTRLERIAKLAKEAPGMAFTSLAHHIDIDLLRAAYRRTRKDGAAGVDGQTAQEYAANLECNLQRLLERAKSGTYRAPPVRRVHIPKGDGSQTRPIGIPTFEDKILQRAVAMVLEHRSCWLPSGFQGLQTHGASMPAVGTHVTPSERRRCPPNAPHLSYRELFLHDRPGKTFFPMQGTTGPS